MRRVMVLALLVSPSLSLAQTPRRVALPAHNARLQTAFTAVTSARELSDGRLLVTDPQDLQLVVADFRTGETKQISRRGQGPGEYGMAAPLYRMGGDSSLMSDFMGRRLLLLSGDKVVATIPADNPIIRATQGFVRFADQFGHVTSTKSPDVPNGESETTIRDSSVVLRHHRTTNKVDTIAKILDRPGKRSITRNEKGEISASSFRSLRLTVGEQHILHSDGWIAVVRINPFRVDWRSVEGRWTRGAQLVPAIRMTEKEKAASRARTAASRAANPSSTPIPPQLQTPDDEWPDVMPPYLQGELTFSPDGDVIIRRQPSADHPGVAYYVVDRRGRLLGIIELKDNERIVGHGASSLYIVETDADDLKYIRRHPWPSVRLPG